MRALAIAGFVLLLAGCTSGGGEITHGRTVIAEDQYYAAAFALDRAAALTISVEVHSGPSIDVIVMDTLNFQQFKSGNNYVHFTSCGGVAAQAFSRTCNLNTGEFVVILDNTDAGSTSPPFNAVNDGADVAWIISAA